MCFYNLLNQISTLYPDVLFYFFTYFISHLANVKIKQTKVCFNLQLDKPSEEEAFGPGEIK